MNKQLKHCWFHFIRKFNWPAFALRLKSSHLLQIDNADYRIEHIPMRLRRNYANH